MLSLGWYDPIDGGEAVLPPPGVLVEGGYVGTQLFDRDLAGTGYGPGIFLNAGVVGYTSGVVAWTFEWSPDGADASPAIADAEDEWVRVGMPTVDTAPFPYGSTSLGTLVITATVDGVPVNASLTLRTTDEGGRTRETWSANQRASSTAIIKRGTIRNIVGIEVDELSVSLLCNVDVLQGNVPLTQFARQGGFDGARMTLTRAFYAVGQTTACGSLNLFSGRVGPLTISGHAIEMGIKSDLELLDIPMPRNVYTAGCIHTLYDAGCNISASTFTVTGNTTANSSAFNINCNLAEAAGYFDLGVMKFTSGLNANVQRTVRVHRNGVLTAMQPFASAPVAGDLFTVRPGCDKTLATCATKFTNDLNFRGYPWIPSPEATY